MSRWSRAALRRRFKARLHRWLDPLLAWHNSRDWRQAMRDVPDGEYHVPLDVPYVSQFASPDRIKDYIHHGYDGRHDPNWTAFGAAKPEDYAFWAGRVCALACLKMAIDAHASADPSPTLWQLVQAGLEANGYILYDENGVWRDVGWYVHAQIAVGARYGLKLTGHSYAAPVGIAQVIYHGQLAAATVTPEIGERQPQTQRYGGHQVVVHGLRWQAGRPAAFLIHNPSGRYPELQANAWIDARRFRQSYAYRFMRYERL